MTAGQLAEKIATEYGEKYLDYVVANQFLDWVQEVSDDLWQAAPWYFRNKIQTVTALQNTRTLEISVEGVISFILISSTTNPTTTMLGKPLVYTPASRIANSPSVNILSDSGVPSNWWYETEGSSEDKATLGFYPVPDYNYTLKVYELEHSPVLSSSTELPYPQDFLPALKQGMRARVKDNDGDPQTAAKHEAQFEKYVARLASTYAGPMGEPSRLQVKRSKAIHQAPVADGAGA